MDGDGGGGSNSWKYIGIGCGVSVLIFLCVVGGCFACTAASCGGALALTQPAVDTAEGFLNDTRSGNLAAAYARTSPEFQGLQPLSSVSVGAFIPLVTGSTGQLSTARNLTSTTEATIGGVLTGGPTVPYAFSLEKVGEQWFIRGFVIGDEQYGVMSPSPFGGGPSQPSFAPPGAPPAPAPIDPITTPVPPPTPTAPSPTPAP